MADYETRSLFEAAAYRLTCGAEPEKYVRVRDGKNRVIVYFRYDRAKIPVNEYGEGHLQVDPLALSIEYLKLRKTINKLISELEMEK